MATALVRHRDNRATIALARWLTAFTEAIRVSEDPQLPEAALALIASLSDEWPSLAIVDEAAVSIDACLSASPLLAGSELVPRAIDELERVVGAAYRPGGGVAHRIDGASHVRGGFGDHVRAAAALLTAYEITARLPYSMLAEELMQASRDDIASSDEFVLSCEAVRVLTRLAALHADPEYRGAAVIASEADYRADAEQVLSRWSAIALGGHADAALYGLALGEWAGQ